MGHALTEDQVAEIRAFTDDQVKEFRRVFSLFDKNSDGDISTAELGEVMRSLGQSPSEAELADMIADADTDHDGCIDFAEFLLMMAKKPRDVDTEAEMRAAFKVFDRDGNGSISVQELRDVMASIGENLTDDEIDLIMSEADRDGNGMIDFDEFLQVLKQD